MKINKVNEDVKINVLENIKTTITAGGVTLASTVDIKGNITASNLCADQFCTKVKKD